MSHIPQDAARRLVDKLGTAAAPHPPIAQPQWMALLVRDVAAEFGVQPLHVCNVLREEGQGDFSVNTAITPDQYAVVCERLKSYASPVALLQRAMKAETEAALLRAALDAETARWEEAVRLTWQMVYPFNPAGPPGSYWRGQDAGIVAALTTLRANLKPPNAVLTGAP